MDKLNNFWGCLSRLGGKGLPLALKTLGKHTVPYFATRKFYLIEKALDRIRKWGVKGDYFEFGLFQGRAFLSAYELKKKMGLDIHLYGFDSFEGLPDFSGKDAEYEVFYPGQYSCSLEKYVSIMDFWNVDEKDYTLIPGFFDKSLCSCAAQNISANHCALAYIDCDLYDSTVPVMNYLTPYLSGGSILIFDDWFSFGGDPYSGQIRAAREWEERNGQFKLLEYHRFNNQVMFVVQDWGE